MYMGKTLLTVGGNKTQKYIHTQYIKYQEMEVYFSLNLSVRPHFQKSSEWEWNPDRSESNGAFLLVL